MPSLEETLDAAKTLRVSAPDRAALLQQLVVEGREGLLLDGLVRAAAQLREGRPALAAFLQHLPVLEMPDVGHRRQSPRRKRLTPASDPQRPRIFRPRGRRQRPSARMAEGSAPKCTAVKRDPASSLSPAKVSALKRPAAKKTAKSKAKAKLAQHSSFHGDPCAPVPFRVLQVQIHLHSCWQLRRNP